MTMSAGSKNGSVREVAHGESYFDPPLVLPLPVSMASPLPLPAILQAYNVAAHY